MSSNRCQAKNPSSCQSPRCPARRGGAHLSPTFPGNFVEKHEEVRQREYSTSIDLAYILDNKEIGAIDSYAMSRPVGLADPDLDSAIEKAGKVDHRFLYKQVSIPDEYTDVDDFINQRFAQGTQFNSQDYLAASASMQTTLNSLSADHNVVLEILTQDGASISSLTNFAEDAEILLGRNKNFTVIGSYNQTLSADGQEYQTTFVQMVDVGMVGKKKDTKPGVDVEKLRQQSVVYSGDKQWNVTTSPRKNKNDIHPDALAYFDEETVRTTTWYHATDREDWFDSITQAQGKVPLVHLGDEAAAMDRATQRAARLGGNWKVYEITLAEDADIHPEVNGDDNGYAPYMAGDEDMVDNYSTVTRYVNEFENPGSISLLVNPKAMRLKTAREIKP